MGNQYKRSFSDSQIEEIRIKYANGDTSSEKIAQEYGCGRRLIDRIGQGTMYKDSPGPISPPRKPRIKDTIRERIRKDYKTRRYTLSELASKYNKSTGSIWRMVNDLPRPHHQGERYRTEFTESDVRKMRIMYSMGGWTYTELENYLHIDPTRSVLRLIILRRNWKYVL